jgi:Zn-dependent M28 family amino/carboxypeptidase
MRLLLAGGVATFTALGLAAIEPNVITPDERKAADTIQARGIRADTRFLSSDLLEGRAPATRGEALAREYVATRFEAIGLEPAAPGGSWYQPVDMVGVTSTCPDEVRVTGRAGSEPLRFGADYIAFSGVQEKEARISDAEIVFVGYGIVAPEYHWDDYKGADLRGKVLLFMNNDPESDPALFEGKRRLYYGRWDYKYAKAAELGAVGALILHTDHSAGYRWQVVQSSFTGEQLSLPTTQDPTLRVKGWLTEEATRRLVRVSGRDLDGLLAQAETREFRPVPLGVRLSLALANQVSHRTGANVIGRLPGRDPVLGKEAVLYTAHHDHLGVRKAAHGEPVVYNGALDNASGVAATLAIAEAFAALPERPRRSILFASVTAEESGLLGSETLAHNPPVPAGRLAANINIDGLNIWGRTRDVAVVGLGKSTLDEWIRAIAKAQDRVVVPESFPDKGSYYRSDHFSLARIGVPSAYIDAGTDVRDRPAGWGRQRQEAWEAAHYHQPSDDLTSDWDLSGAVEDAQLLFLVGSKVADTPLSPTWRPGDEFEAARKKALAAVGAP